VFTLVLDMQPGQPQDLGGNDLAAQIPIAAKSLHTLVVEDNDINQMVARVYLERMGHSCVCVPTAEQGLDQLRSGAFDVVLMDLNLPGMSGSEATRQIRAELGLADIPVIGISAHVQQDDITAQLDLGMDCFVAKPVSPVRLAQALDDVAHGRKRGVFLSSRQPPDATSPTATALAANLRDLGPEQTHRIARLYLDQLAGEQARLVEALRQGNGAGAKKQAHRMKGAAGNFDLRALMAFLARIEATPDPAQIDELDRAIHNARSDLNDALRTIDPDPKPDFGPPET
jgi:two-component system sensor histidine kinase TorS